MNKRTSSNHSSFLSWIIKRLKESDGMLLVSSSVPVSDCNMIYTYTPLTTNTGTLDPQTSNLKTERMNMQPITSNLNNFTINIRYFVKSSFSNLSYQINQIHPSDEGIENKSR